MKKRTEKPFNIAIGVLFAAALLFIGLSIFSRMADHLYLVIGLICSLLGNLLNLIKILLNKRKS